MHLLDVFSGRHRHDPPRDRWRDMNFSVRIWRALAVFGITALTGSSILASRYDFPDGAHGSAGGGARTVTATGNRLLSAFGAVGDGRADDTTALQKAFDTAAGQCLDGEGRTFLVSGSLRAGSDLCLKHVRIVQAPARSTTRAFIAGACVMTVNPEAVIDCHDAPLASRDTEALRTYTQTRTLFIRPAHSGAALQVHLQDVTIDRGNDPRSGSRADAAGIWIENATEVLLETVTITGAGKGYGLMIAHSSNVAVRGLYIHDLVWAPYDGDTPLSLARVQREGWNRPMVRELRFLHKGGNGFGFGGTRVQEQLVCVMIAGSRQVTLRDTRIDGCRARFAEGDLPWQADGIDISQDSRDVSIEGDTQVSNTWEGIDIAGTGVEAEASNLRIKGASITDSFAFGVKLGHRLTDVRVSDTRISGAGLAGVVLYGPIDGIVLEGLRLNMADRRRVPLAEWPATKVGILIERSGEGVPTNLRLADIAVSGGASCTAGVQDRAGARPEIADLRISGCATRYAVSY